MQDFSPDEGKTRKRIQERLQGIFENGWLNHYLIDLRFDIDLPLYRDHKLFS